MWDFRCGAEREECVRTPAVFALKAWESNSEHNSTGRHGIGTECDEMLSVSVLEVPRHKNLWLGIFIGIIGGVRRRVKTTNKLSSFFRLPSQAEGNKQSARTILVDDDDDTEGHVTRRRPRWFVGLLIAACLVWGLVRIQLDLLPRICFLSI